MAATGLPLIVVITTIGRADGFVSAQNAAALVTAGMLSVLLLPALAVRVAGRQSGRPDGGDRDGVAA